MILRPRRLPEAIWAVAGALALVLSTLLPWTDALEAVGRGTDVYLFLIGMMLLAELARQEGLFDWLAALATRQARGSPRRLFGLVYLVGILVTVFLSNDATAVVLTPAVYAAARAAGAEPLPYLFICAFIANAASFVLPISNPANLVIFGRHMPPLGQWLAQFALPSIFAVATTFLVLRFTQRWALRQPIAREVALPRLPPGGALAAGGIVVTALALLAASALDRPLGLPTFVAGSVSVAAVLLYQRAAPWDLLRGVSWSVLPLVAGLFVLVAGVERTGVLEALAGSLAGAAERSAADAAWSAGLLSALASNLMNNLPVGLVAGSLGRAADVPLPVTGALLVGVDLGPNLSVTGSLATILWLVALRREGVHVGAMQFLRLGLIVTPPALVLALAALLLSTP
ncbi:MAG TPA: arsenic transporter [Aliidongia sp.]|nr:arsenic transporter [Aliidongia sp.]